ncbi:MAG TPA: glycosyltransferase family 4 protein [Pyrinomonadaceae bacterium]|nr:glycosyltransferase family 4 protein [Pyrinomonadaceae bacterium]
MKFLESELKKKPQILFVWNYLDWGGAQIYFLAIMKEARRDWRVKVILPRKSSKEIIRFIEQIGVEYEFIDTYLDNSPAPNLKRKLQRQWRRIHAETVAFKHLLKYDLRKTILHIETAPWQSWLFLTALAMRGANIFVTMHNSLPKTSGWREFLWRRRMQFVSRLKNFHIFPSNQDTKNSLEGWVAPEFLKKTKVTYTSVNPVEIEEVLKKELDRERLCKKHGLPADKFLALCVGQFIDRKGRWIFLEAAQKVLQKTSEIAFVWLTPKLPEEEERRKIDEYNLGNSFHLVLSETVGKKRKEVLNFFRLSNVFALPSFVEGLPIALLEAMALGIPSISTNVNAIPEAILDKKTGLLVPAGDSRALAKAILTLYSDENLRENLSNAGRNWVLGHFDEREAARIAIESYKECFKRNTKKGRDENV